MYISTTSLLVALRNGVNLTSDSHFDRPVRLIVFYTVGSVSYKYLELFSYHTSFISWIHVWWKVWVYQYKNSEHYYDIFSQSGLLYPWRSSLLTRNLYIWNKDLAQSDWSTNLTWHYLGWPKSSFFFQNLSISVSCEDLFCWIFAFWKVTWL